jgi:hypothetical protein
MTETTWILTFDTPLLLKIIFKFTCLLIGILKKSCYLLLLLNPYSI